MPGPFRLAAYAKLERERRYILTIESQLPDTAISSRPEGQNHDLAGHDLRVVNSDVP
jgi:hypothetical protein